MIVCVRVWECAWVCVCICTCMSVGACLCMCACVCRCVVVCVCIYMCKYVRMYIYIYILYTLSLSLSFSLCLCLCLCLCLSLPHSLSLTLSLIPACAELQKPYFHSFLVFVLRFSSILLLEFFVCKASFPSHLMSFIFLSDWLLCVVIRIRRWWHATLHLWRKLPKWLGNASRFLNYRSLLQKSPIKETIFKLPRHLFAYMGWLRLVGSVKL